MNNLNLILGCDHIRSEGWINTDSSLNSLIPIPLGALENETIKGYGLSLYMEGKKTAH
jgi:hypothetical protein